MANSRDNQEYVGNIGFKLRKHLSVVLFGDEQTKAVFMNELKKSYSTETLRGITTVKQNDTYVDISDARHINSNDLRDTEVVIACCSDINDLQAIFDAISKQINTPKLQTVTYLPTTDINFLISNVANCFEDQKIEKPSQSIFSSIWSKIGDVKRGMENASKQKEIQKNQPTSKGLN